MRFNLWVLSVLMGCLFLFLGLGLGPGHTQDPIAPRIAPDQVRRDAPIHAPSNQPVTSPIIPADWIEERFRKLDRNGDGLLSHDEMTENLRIEKNRWDVNGDGMIDLDEWRKYVEAFRTGHHPPPPVVGTLPKTHRRDQKVSIQEREQRVLFPIREQHVQPLPGGEQRSGVPAVRPPFKEREPAKARAAPRQWPRNIPEWFKEYDTDGDGQVSLTEWKEKEVDTREFRLYDLNGDGFISLRELIQSGQYLTGMNSPPVLVGTNPEVGQFYYWEITGSTQGDVFGTDIYTIDSPMGTTAVHAGVLQPGQTAFLKVILLPGQQHYDGSYYNGVMSKDRHTGYHKSFRVEAIP